MNNRYKHAKRLSELTRPLKFTTTEGYTGLSNTNIKERFWSTWKVINCFPQFSQ